jgi:ectoine hydroxylase-related dioxygenase (phytanoyl-CoA dioxygenase family)
MKGITLPTDLWFDQPDADQHIDQLQTQGQISETEARRLQHFVDFGFLLFPLEGEPALFERLQDDIDRLWRERSDSVAYAYYSPPHLLSESDEATERKPRYRIHDLHSASEVGLALYLNKQIHAYMELLFGQPSVAVQSLYFEYGSQQIPHRDPQLVPASPPSHLLAAWIALEDIHPDCGPLTYVPGSHRVPYFEFEPGQFRFDAGRMGEEQITAARNWDLEQCARRGLEAQVFTAKQGDVLIWHHSLLHGGSEIKNPVLTRKSLVVHFSTKAHYHSRGIRLYEKDADGRLGNPRVFRTQSLLQRGDCLGFDNPLNGTIQA